jgi:tRNA dimethylallyltransferase
VIRALEIYYVTGKRKSEQADAPIPRFDFVCVSIDHPREILYKRINQRVDVMAEQGLMEEVQSLRSQGLTLEYQSMQGIGYKEILQGVDEGQTMEEILENIKKNTRNYAKRQITFFKRMQNHTVLHANEVAVEKVLKLL